MSEIGKEYGAALFMLACEQDTLTDCAAGLDTVKSAFTSQPDYSELLASPSIPLSERLASLSAAFADEIPESVLSLLQLMCEKGRISCFYEAADEFTALLNARNGMSRAQIISAAALTEEQKKKLQQKLEQYTKGRVETTYTTDPTLLGGLIVNLDGKVLDGSLQGRLRDIKDVINT
jgi:F-type H+-transporting ATPase subunit delta